MDFHQTLYNCLNLNIRLVDLMWHCSWTVVIFVSASHQKLPIVPLELQFCDDESTAPMRKVTGQKSSAADCTLDEVHQMELDTSSCGRDTSNCVRQTLFQNPTDDHFALDTEHSAHVSSQDIGYYTNSLTNQDTGFQSRNNLTNNDTEMLSVTNQDTGFQSGCSSTSSLISGPIVHSDLTNQFGQLPVVCDDLDPTFNDHLDNSHPVRRMSFSLDDDIIFRARKVLGKPPEGTLGQMSSKSVILSDVSNTLEKQDQMRESEYLQTSSSGSCPVNETTVSVSIIANICVRLILFVIMCYLFCSCCSISVYYCCCVLHNSYIYISMCVYILYIICVCGVCV